MFGEKKKDLLGGEGNKQEYRTSSKKGETITTPVGVNEALAQKPTSSCATEEKGGDRPPFPQKKRNTNSSNARGTSKEGPLLGSKKKKKISSTA